MARKKGRSSKVKPKVTILSPEDQQRRDQVDLFLRDFDCQCDLSIKELWRDKDAAVAQINTMYKLELMKLPQEVRDMKWDDYYNQSISDGKDPLALSKTITECLEDTICSKVDTQVSQVKSALRTASKKRTRRGTSPGKNSRTTTRSRKRSKILSASSCEESTSPRQLLPPRSNSALRTPAYSRRPPNVGKTPLITPKFDTSKRSRTVSRVARADEVLISLSGSPVVAAVSKKIPKSQENNALIQLGGGETLNIPLGVVLAPSVEYLDDQQLERLGELQQSLANMLKVKNQARE